mmetsp:Transcript_7231/g.8182  ORF Transcript_7231/g.8182 Transcript_7231/m.8182 type:complete len:151 (+) Transcript_7231:193-645(+)
MLTEIAKKLSLPILLPELGDLAKNIDNLTFKFINSLYLLMTESGVVNIEEEKEMRPILSTPKKTIKFAEESKQPILTQLSSAKKIDKSSLRKTLVNSSQEEIELKIQRPIPQNLTRSLIHQVKIKSIEIKPIKMGLKELRKLYESKQNLE